MRQFIKLREKKKVVVHPRQTELCDHLLKYDLFIENTTLDFYFLSRHTRKTAAINNHWLM